jgi:lipid-A-disaccharide synthase
MSVAQVVEWRAGSSRGPARCRVARTLLPHSWTPERNQGHAPRLILTRVPHQRLLISCGEASGDLYAAELLRHVRAERPDLRWFGLGGDGVAAQGAEIVAHVRDLAVLGLVEVVSKLSDLRRTFSRLLQEVDREPPALAVLVDYSGFNLRLAKQLRRRGIPILYYVSPQVWAWRRGRLRTIRATVARMMVLFPFEVALYEAAGVPVTFVGHPLVDLVRPAPDRTAFLRACGLDAERPLIAVLPGSRPKEIAYNLPPLAEAIRRLSALRPSLQWGLAVAPSLAPDDIRATLGEPRVTLLSGQAHALVGAAELGLIASGTATVETALLGTPMVVVYRVSPLSYALGRPFVRVAHFAMVNLVAQKRVVPELIQRDFTPARVVSEALALLDDPARAGQMRADLAEVRRRLGAPGASARAARVVLDALAPA